MLIKLTLLILLLSLSGCMRQIKPVAPTPPTVPGNALPRTMLLPNVTETNAVLFKLSSKSSAIDAAATLSEFNTDIEGAPKPQGLRWDIGGFEYTDPYNLGAPTNLRVVK